MAPTLAHAVRRRRPSARPGAVREGERGEAGRGAPDGVDGDVVGLGGQGALDEPVVGHEGDQAGCRAGEGERAVVVPAAAAEAHAAVVDGQRRDDDQAGVGHRGGPQARARRLEQPVRAGAEGAATGERRPVQRGRADRHGQEHPTAQRAGGVEHRQRAVGGRARLAADGDEQADRVAGPVEHRRQARRQRRRVGPAPSSAPCPPRRQQRTGATRPCERVTPCSISSSSTCRGPRTVTSPSTVDARAEGHVALETVSDDAPASDGAPPGKRRSKSPSIAKAPSRARRPAKSGATSAPCGRRR